ncbi:MAG: SpoIIE family protein phosphatase [Planctomycetes bacterium]|jgi:phosphoserine phosphatase|nr:SpoIIE family protein phosphatase [Planctomycetota bacterium]
MSMTDDEQNAPRGLDQVLEITRAMGAAGDLDELLTLIVDRSLALLQAERGTVWLHDVERHELVTRVATGVDELRVPADKGFCGEAVQATHTIVCQDAYADARFNPEVDRQTGFRTRNLMSVPLSDFEGRVNGVLQVLNLTGDITDQDVALAEALAAQAGVAVQRAQLMEHYARKQEMERAMQIAQDIQQGLLPKSAPWIDGFDAAGRSDPADETGGDTFDFIPLPDGQWGFVVADATGHGIGPALVIAETRAMLRASAMLAESAECRVCRVLATANRLLVEDLDGSRFVTCFFGILDPASATLTWASAGHGPMIFYRRGEESFEEVGATDVPLGILPDTAFEAVETFRFEPGDLAVVTTDGIFEAPDADDEMFGVPGMIDQLRATSDRSAAEIVNGLRLAVDRHTVGTSQADDITAIVIRRWQ